MVVEQPCQLRGSGAAAPGREAGPGARLALVSVPRGRCASRRGTRDGSRWRRSRPAGRGRVGALGTCCPGLLCKRSHLSKNALSQNVLSQNGYGVLWVPEGNLAGIFRVGFPVIFGQTWPQDPSRSPGLALQFNLHEKSAPQTNSKAIS